MPELGVFRIPNQEHGIYHDFLHNRVQILLSQFGARLSQFRGRLIVFFRNFTLSQKRIILVQYADECVELVNRFLFEEQHDDNLQPWGSLDIPLLYDSRQSSRLRFLRAFWKRKGMRPRDAPQLTPDSNEIRNSALSRRPYLGVSVQIQIAIMGIEIPESNYRHDELDSKFQKSIWRIG